MRKKDFLFRNGLFLDFSAYLGKVSICRPFQAILVTKLGVLYQHWKLSISGSISVTRRPMLDCLINTESCSFLAVAVTNVGLFHQRRRLFLSGSIWYIRWSVWSTPKTVPFWQYLSPRWINTKTVAFWQYLSPRWSIESTPKTVPFWQYLSPRWINTKTVPFWW